MKLSKNFKEILRTGKSIGVLTGAGISADCGIKTFRGKDGLWNNVEVEKLATLKGFLENPKVVWEWYNSRRMDVSENEPSPGHKGLVEMEKYFDVNIITQNIDGFHQKAGSKNVIELHGNIWEFRCMEHGDIIKNTDVPLSEIPPRCERGALYRPNVVWFGEALPQDALNNSMKVASSSDIFVVIGTSAVVQPAASIPIIAKRAGAFIVEINIEDTPLSYFADESIKGRAKDIIPGILDEIKKIKET